MKFIISLIFSYQNLKIVNNYSSYPHLYSSILQQYYSFFSRRESIMLYYYYSQNLICYYYPNSPQTTSDLIWILILDFIIIINLRLCFYSQLLRVVWIFAWTEFSWIFNIKVWLFLQYLWLTFCLPISPTSFYPLNPLNLKNIFLQFCVFFRNLS